MIESTVSTAPSKASRSNISLSRELLVIVNLYDDEAAVPVGINCRVSAPSGVTVNAMVSYSISIQPRSDCAVSEIERPLR